MKFLNPHYHLDKGANPTGIGSQKALHTLTFSLLLAATLNTNAVELTLEKGYDSNPHKISAPPYSATYTGLQLQHADKHSLKNKASLSYHVKVNSKWYQDPAKTADSQRIDARVRWANRFKIGEKTANLLLTADLRSDQSNYFSQLQRQIATTSRGDSLEDRFNYRSAKLAAELIYRFDKQKSLSLHSYIAQRNYQQDYSELGVEGLDFKEINLQPTFRYKAKNGLYLRPFVYLRYRHYDQLLNDNSDGRNIIGSTLTYRFTGYGLVANKPLTDNLTVKSYINGYWARDNAQGYRDLNYHKWELGLEYTLGNTRQLALKNVCYSKDYLQDSFRAMEAETGDAGRKRTGCYVEGIYRQPLNIGLGDKLSWQIKASSEKEDNSETVLSYQRSTVAVGIHYQF